MEYFKVTKLPLTIGNPHLNMSLRWLLNSRLLRHFYLWASHRSVALWSIGCWTNPISWAPPPLYRIWFTAIATLDQLQLPISAEPPGKLTDHQHHLFAALSLCFPFSIRRIISYLASTQSLVFVLSSNFATIYILLAVGQHILLCLTRGKKRKSTISTLKLNTNHLTVRVLSY